MKKLLCAIVLLFSVSGVAVADLPPFSDSCDIPSNPLCGIGQSGGGAE